MRDRINNRHASQHRLIVALMLASLAVHAGFMLWLESPTPNKPIQPPPPSKVLALRLTPYESETQQPKNSDASADGLDSPPVNEIQPESPPPKAQSQVELDSLEQEQAQKRTLSTQTPPPTPAKKAPSLNMLSIAEQIADMEMEQAQSGGYTVEPACTEAQRRNPMYECADEIEPDEHGVTKDPYAIENRAMQELVTNLTNHLRSAPDSSAYVDDKLDQIDELLADLDNVAVLNENGEINPAARALAAQQRRELTEQILHQDAQLASVNLLRLIPIATRTVRGLKESSQSGTTPHSETQTSPPTSTQSQAPEPASATQEEPADEESSESSD